MPVTSGVLRASRSLRARIGAAIDDTVRALADSWVAGWGQLQPRWQVAARNLAAVQDRLGHRPAPIDIARTPGVGDALDATATELDDQRQHADELIAAAIVAVVAAVLAAEPRLIGLQFPSRAADDITARVVARIQPHTVDALTVRALQATTVQIRALPAAVHNLVRRRLIAGPAPAGQDPAARTVAAVRQAFDTGLTSAVTTARTEPLDAARTVAAHVHSANTDLLAGWIWVASLGPRCCPACWAMHGTTHPLSEPGPLDHHCGRCVRLPKAVPWQTAGYGDEPGNAIPDAQTVFAALPAAQQLKIMGRRRLELLTAGRITWADLAVRRSNRGWRDTYVPRPVRDLERLAKRRTAPPA